MLGVSDTGENLRANLRTGALFEHREIWPCDKGKSDRRRGQTDAPGSELAPGEAWQAASAMKINANYLRNSLL
jgi:hypothetical protein